MKKITLTLIACMLLLAACKKDADTKSNSSSDYYLSAEVDGVPFYADATHNKRFNIEYVANDNSTTVNQLWIDVIDSTGTSEILLETGDGYGGTPYLGAGSYNVSDTLANYYYNSLDNAGDVSSWGTKFNTANVGTVAVTSDANSVVEGTFQFSAINNSNGTVKQITNGKFKLPVVYHE